MASDCDFLDFVLGQVADLGNDITWRKMMGEYIIYYRGKIIGGIYDNRFLVKPVESVMKNIPGEMALPYESGKQMFMITDIDNPDCLCRAIQLVYNDLHKI